MSIIKLLLCLASSHYVSATREISSSQVLLQNLVDSGSSISVLKDFIANSGPELGFSKDPDDVHFHYYPSREFKTEIIYNDYVSLAASLLNSTKPTVFIVPGFLSNSSSQMAQLLTRSYLDYYRSEVNVIVVDFSPLSGAGVFLSNDSEQLALAMYHLVLNNVPVVGERLAEFINFLGVEVLGVHLVGHGLGAHICGMAGDYAQKHFGISYSRISGLDPAGMILKSNTAQQTSNSLHRNNAIFVDAYHSDMGHFGTTDPSCGTVDVFINGGGGLNKPQPGCATLDMSSGNLQKGRCSHSYAWKFFAYTIFNQIDAVPCTTKLKSSLPSCFSTTPPEHYEKTVSIEESTLIRILGQYSVYSENTFTEFVFIYRQ